MVRSQVNKAHKSRFSSKSSRDVHRTSKTDKKRISKPTSQHGVKGNRAARIKTSKLARDKKRAAALKDKRAGTGASSSPRVIVLFGLSTVVDVHSLARDLLSSLVPEDVEASSRTVSSSNYKFRATVLIAPYGDLLGCMEMAKVADHIAFVASASHLCETGYIGEFGSHCISVLKSLGLPSISVLMRDLPADLKEKHDLKKMCLSNLASEFSEDCKFYPVDSKDDIRKFLWLFKEQKICAPHWRGNRPYILAEEVNMIPNNEDLGMSTLVLSGYLRSHFLSANQLVHVAGVGDFQISKIDILSDPCPLTARKHLDLMDSDDSHGIQVIRSLIPDPLKQEELLVENVADPLSGEQTWPTEAEMADADRLNSKQKKKVPVGTSNYQSAWIVEDTDDEASDNSDGDGEGMVLDDDGLDPKVKENEDDLEIDEEQLENVGEETDTDTMMGDVELTRQQIEDEIRKVKEDHADDEDFPDEVDTPLDVAARVRFAKFRGLKSFRTSPWDPKESLPHDYARIFAFDNFAKTQKIVQSKVLALDQGTEEECAAFNNFVRIYIQGVPSEIASKLCVSYKIFPVTAWGLLQHESKMSVLHFSIKKHDLYEDPVKSKEALIFNVGFRQFHARPVFSSDNINSDKHKMERFLHAGQFAVASVYAPISFPPLPLIVLKSPLGNGTQPSIVAVGSLRSIDPDRIILKRIILTGYPQRVSKLKASVRFMFHKPEDVRWFKPVEVWTKGGRRGRISEPVGTHGAMKCVFNGVVQQNDTVCMSLYKRVFPRWPEQLYTY